MKYEDWRKQRQDSFSKLPLKAAFSQKQFEEMMSEWGTNNKRGRFAEIATPWRWCLLPED